MSAPVRRDGPAARRAPGVLDWAALLRLNEDIDRGLLEVYAVGIEYGSNEAVYGELVFDSLALPTALLAPDAEALARAAVDAVGCAEQAVYALGSLAENVALAAGAPPDDDGARSRAAALAYDSLGRAFGDWLRTLEIGSAPLEREQAWQKTVRQIVARHAAVVVGEAGSAALVGRVVGAQFRDAGIAERWFWRKLREVLPHAFDDTIRAADAVATSTQEDA
jgi:CRISPR system Cascade subunit CasA